MIGTIVNALAIIVGGIVGTLFRGGIPERMKETLMQGISLAVVIIGTSMALQAKDFLTVIGAMVIGGVVGEWLRIEDGLAALGHRLEQRIKTEGGLARGFIAASLVYCVGAMAIMGALQDGLTGDHATLFAKAMLDGISSVILASTLGIGVSFSALPVVAWQGLIALTATWIAPILSPDVVTAMTAVGGLLLMGVGTNLLNVTRIRVGNLTPAIFAAALIVIARAAFGF
jgi:uncharacterized membrane protein YqgA involved in biofilm formation